MALLFVLKKKFEGGISSSEIGVRSLAKITSEPGVLKLECRGVSAAIGLPIFVNFFSGCHDVRNKTRIPVTGDNA